MSAKLEKIPFVGDVATGYHAVKGGLQTVNHFRKGEIALGIQRGALAAARVGILTLDTSLIAEAARPAIGTVLEAADHHLDAATRAHRQNALAQAARPAALAPAQPGFVQGLARAA